MSVSVLSPEGRVHLPEPNTPELATQEEVDAILDDYFEHEVPSVVQTMLATGRLATINRDHANDAIDEFDID